MRPPSIPTAICLNPRHLPAQWVSASSKAGACITSRVCTTPLHFFHSLATDPLPGTATLSDLTDPTATTAHSSTAHLKRAADGTILVPQPSSDPADPLNWPLWRRDVITTILCLLSVIASTLSPLLAANTLTLTLYFEKPFTDIALLTGWHLFGVGVSGFIFTASARVYGKRHLYLLGTVVIIVSSAWGGGSGHNYKSLLAARVFQGVGLAPFEALVNASVGDLYFVHERGKRMALSNLSLFGGAFFTPVIVGKMTSTLGWQWTFYFIAIFTAAMLPLVIVSPIQLSPRLSL